MNAPDRALLATTLTVLCATVAVGLAALTLRSGLEFATFESAARSVLSIIGLVLVVVLAVAAVSQQRRSVRDLTQMPKQGGSGSTLETEPAGFSRARFIADLGHDLRQPLHALGLFLDALEPRVTPGEGEKILSRAREATNAMSRGFNALIDLVRVEADALVPEMERFAIDDFLIRLYEDSSEAAAAAGVELRLAHAQADVVGDVRLTAYIARVLLANVVDLGEGRLLIGVRKRANVLWLELHCAKQGKLAPKWQNVLTPMSAPPADFKAPELDLFVARRLADLLAIDLRVTAKADRGVVLAIGLPLAGDEASLPLRGRAILLVADDSAGASAPATALARAGAVVHVASNPRQAEYAKRVGKIDLLVTELAGGNAGVRERLAPGALALPNRTPPGNLVAAALAAKP